MDSKLGQQLYKFDMSLMERLSSSGFPMSQIDVQRRMRPTISNLIRQGQQFSPDCPSQGCYSQEGDIVVLCAYLGQLARVRDALADLIAVVIDERDQAELADQEADQETDFNDDTHVEHVKVARRVRAKV
ncbi:hypothetical protein C0992_005272 [Termitomyces sp. T32_za158]|nr:hypothetical protein C0992_005272 [Termitomyces sp. T32_za158]